MKLASAEPIVWLIIAIVVAISKGLGKLKAPTQPPETGDDDAPPPQPRRQPLRQPRPVSTPPSSRLPERITPSNVRPDREVVQRQAPPRDFRDLLAQLTNPPVKATVVPPKITAPPPPKREPPKAAEVPKAKPEAKAPAVNRNTQWADALRDRSNVRNIIIAAEIIGPPRGA